MQLGWLTGDRSDRPAAAVDPDGPASCSSTRCSTGRPDAFVDALRHLILPAIALGLHPARDHHPHHAGLRARRRATRTTSGPRAPRASARGAVDNRHIMRNAWLPVDHRDRPPGRRAPRRRGHHRDRVRLERGRHVGRRRDPEPRLLRDPELHPDLRVHLPDGEPGRRHRDTPSSTRGSGTPDGRPTTARRRSPGTGAPAGACGATPSRRLLRNRPALLGHGVHRDLRRRVAVLAPVMAPYDPNKGSARPALGPPTPRICRHRQARAATSSAG